MGRSDRPLRPALGVTSVAVVLATLMIAGVHAPRLGPGPEGSASPIGYSPAPLSPFALGILAGGYGRILVNSTDSSIVPNDGLRTNITAFPGTTLPTGSSFQAGAEEAIGSYEAVFGLFQNSVHSPTPFFSVFQAATPVFLEYWTNFTVISGQSYDFELTRQTGTNWTLTVNSLAFGGNSTYSSFDFGANESIQLDQIDFSETAIYTTTSSVPTDFTIPLALAVRHSGSWALPKAASSFYLSNAQTPPWGVEGRLDVPTLAPGELRTGTSVAASGGATGHPLWTGGVVPLRVALAFGENPVPGTRPVSVSVNVTTSSGAPVPSVSVYVKDQRNGTFLPPAVTTGSNGGIISLFTPPNVSATTSDLVTAEITLFGYSGSAGSSLTITPPVQIIIQQLSWPGPLSPGANVSLDLQASDTEGSPVPGLLLAFAVSQGAVLGSTFALTGSDGHAQASLVTPGQGGSVVRLTVTVASSGAWGHLIVDLPVGSAPTHGFPWASVLSYGVPIGVGAGLGLLVMIAVFRWRRPKQPMPAMPGLRAKGAEANRASRTPLALSSP